VSTFLENHVAVEKVTVALLSTADPDTRALPIQQTLPAARDGLVPKQPTANTEVRVPEYVRRELALYGGAGLAVLVGQKNSLVYAVVA
jgi:hypothetical protein